MKIYKGNILTVNKEDEVAGYLVEDNGRIAFVGNELPEKYQGSDMIDLGEKALIPAFVDTHQHFASFSTFQAGLNVMDAESNVEIQEMIKEFYSRSKGKSLIAFGASPYSVKEKKLISREELDAVCPDKEIMVVKYDGHACIVNTLLLNRMRDQVKDLRGYHPDTGEMNQEAFFKFSDALTGSLSLIDLFRNMQDSVDFQASKGIGMVHTVSGVGFPGDMDITFEKIFAKSLKNGFQVRVFPQSLDIKTALKRKLPRIGGCFECALDGCFGSHDASMNEPYIDEEGGDGVLYYSDEKVIDFCKKANRAGLQIEMHAIGDKAFDQATRALKAALDDFPRKDHRHGIIHDCLPTEEGIRICREYGIQMPVQSAFIDWKQEPNEYLVSIMGEERASRLNPLKTFADNGIVISFGSDAPCTSPDPIVWIDKAVNNKEQSVTVQQALRMCTYNGCYTTFDEKERGSLEEGKIADMVILSGNPYTVGNENLKDLKVEKLILQGRDYESCRSGVLGSVLKGLFSGSKAY
ncbi:MAG: amidohydrolase family protein [Christensenellaceae bacterium]|nr:amidohydrolase family protein [Christensenellaceae bacterium]